NVAPGKRHRHRQRLDRRAAGEAAIGQALLQLRMQVEIFGKGIGKYVIGHSMTTAGGGAIRQTQIMGCKRDTARRALANGKRGPHFEISGKTGGEQVRLNPIAACAAMNGAQRPDRLHPAHRLPDKPLIVPDHAMTVTGTSTTASDPDYGDLL